MVNWRHENNPREIWIEILKRLLKHLESGIVVYPISIYNNIIAAFRNNTFRDIFLRIKIINEAKPH